jgi:hypothetical protein
MTIPTEAVKASLTSSHTQSVINIFVLITLVIGIFASTIGVINNQRQANYTACLARYNSMAQASSQARAALNQEQIDATNKVIVTVATARTRKAVATALHNFTVTQDKIADQKAQHPVPPGPNKVCK